MSRWKKRMVILGALTIALLLGYIAYAIEPLRRPVTPVGSTKILDREGTVLYEVTSDQGERRTLVTLDTIPQVFKNALIASEDARFYDHHGVDVAANLRALKDLILEGRVISGASTLEQQVVKNLYFPNQPRSILHKVREMIASVYWSYTHTKEQTLETYSNVVFFGSRSSGLEAAAQGYFHKSVHDLTLAESALLVGVIPAPSESDPYHHWKVARLGQQKVLDRMLSKGVITKEEHDEALAAAIDIFPPRHDIQAPHFVFHVLSEGEGEYPGIREGGFVIHTTLDPTLQRFAEETIRRRLSRLADEHVTDGALLALDPRTGDVLAYVGSRDYFDPSIQGQVDMVQARRQPGSALKPFLYFQAFQQGFTPASVIADVPVRFSTSEGKSYYPRNYGYQYHGPVSLREALGSSLNIPAVKLLDTLGISSFVGTLGRFGIRFPESPDHYGLSLVLGGGETTLADVTQAYASLARYAKSVPPRTILEVRDQKNKQQVIQGAPKQVPLFPLAPQAEQAAWLVTNVLSDVQARFISFGEANLLDMGKAVAAKTGTTKDFRDNWAFGYTPDLVIGVWVGNADNTAMQGVSRITGAVPILHDVMQFALQNEKDVVWPPVKGIVTKQICIPSGKLVSEVCPKSRRERFISGTEPTEVDDWYQRVDLDAKTGFIATNACRTQMMRKTFFHPPPEYDAWIATKSFERMPTKDCEGRSVSSDPSRTILSPLDGDQFEQATSYRAESAAIPFIAGGGSGDRYRWKLNGRIIEANTPTYFWKPEPGTFTLELEGASRAVQFSVQ